MINSQFFFLHEVVAVLSINHLLLSLKKFLFQQRDCSTIFRMIHIIWLILLIRKNWVLVYVSVQNIQKWSIIFVPKSRIILAIMSHIVWPSRVKWVYLTRIKHFCILRISRIPKVIKSLIIFSFVALFMINRFI